MTYFLVFLRCNISPMLDGSLCQAVICLLKIMEQSCISCMLSWAFLVQKHTCTCTWSHGLPGHNPKGHQFNCDCIFVSFLYSFFLSFPFMPLVLCNLASRMVFLLQVWQVCTMYNMLCVELFFFYCCMFVLKYCNLIICPSIFTF